MTDFDFALLAFYFAQTCDLSGNSSEYKFCFGSIYPGSKYAFNENQFLYLT
jgi:hypothetical protein